MFHCDDDILFLIIIALLVIGYFSECRGVTQNTSTCSAMPTQDDLIC